MYYQPPERARPRRQRSALDSPILAGAIVVVVVAGAAAVVLNPGLLPGGGPTPTASQVAGAASATPPGSVAPTFRRPTPSPGPSFLTYGVKRGDTLSTIAKRFDTTERSIAWWNRGFYPSLDPESSDYNPDTIRVGWELHVLDGVVVNDDNPPAPEGTPRETPRPRDR